MKTPTAWLALLLWTVAWPTPGIEPATAGSAGGSAGSLRRCVGADGMTIFTDRRCEDLQAVESTQPMAPIQAGAPVRVRTCARNQDELLFGVRSALENGDVNQFAEYYHWTGLGSAAGYRIMSRLSAFMERPLVDVRLVSNREQEDYWAPDTEGDEYRDRLDQEDSGATLARPRPPRAPDLLRVDQMRSNEAVASQVTYFHLRRNAGCWWVQF